MIDDTPITRRSLLAAGGAALAAASLPGVAQAARRPSWLDRDTFAERVGETFVMRHPSGDAVPVRLKSVRDVAGTTLRGRSLRGRADAFILTFEPVSGTPAGDVTSTFSHPRLGSTLFFAAAGARTYTVIVNRAIAPGPASSWSSPGVRMRRAPSRRRRRTPR